MSRKKSGKVVLNQLSHTVTTREKSKKTNYKSWGPPKLGNRRKTPATVLGITERGLRVSSGLFVWDAQQ
jgi:hypothetical protein